MGVDEQPHTTQVVRAVTPFITRSDLQPSTVGQSDSRVVGYSEPAMAG